MTSMSLFKTIFCYGVYTTIVSDT